MYSKANDLDDDDLREMLKADLDQYFPELVVSYESRLKTYAFNLLGHWQDAEEVVQDAFLRAYFALKGYSSERLRALRLRAWLYVIVKNTCYNYCREKKKSSLSISLSTWEEDDQFPEREAAQSYQPEVVIETRERRHEIEQAVQALSPCYREMVRLHLLEGFSCQEIADLLDRPIGTVKNYVYRGRKIVAKRLAEDTDSYES